MSNTSRFLPIALAVLLAGFAIRIALHDYHGLEGDDGFSLALSRYPLDTLVPGLMNLQLDVHPPLHFVALKGWTALAGDSLLSLRLMNILADVLTGALVIRLTGRLFGRRAGITAGGLWVVAPLLIYATYLIRMYSLEATFVTAGAVCAIESIHTRRVAWAVGLAVCALAALYTHIVGMVAVGAFALGLVAAAFVYRDLQRILAGFLALAVAGVLYLPFAVPLWNVYRSGRTLGASINTSAFASASDIPGTIARVLLFHRLALPGLLVLALLILGSIGLLWGKRARTIVPLQIVAWAGVLGMMALGWAADLYKPRYLAPFVPPVLALIAGMVAPRRRQQRIIPLARYVVPIALLVILSGMGIHADLDRTTRDDWIAAAQFIAAHERPGDAVIVIPDWGQEAFKFHYRGRAPVTGIFPRLSPDVDYAPVLQSLVEGHDGVWLVRYQPEVSDVDNLAERWFRERAASVVTVFPAGMQVQYYDLAPQKATLPPDAHPLDARFGDVAALRGVYLPLTQGSARDTRLHPPSNWVQVVLYWESLESGADFVPRVRLTSPAAEVYGAALDTDNGVLSRSPVTTWQAGQVWQVAYTLNLNPDSPPGVYNVEVMVLDPLTGEPLPTTGADAGAFWVIGGQYEISE
jgi:4-amino-4-deoxy-L-arabinose transferase-like glycosyltransferase